MNVVDSSAWLEHSGNFKRTHQLKGEVSALEAIAVMLQGRMLELPAGLALDAAKLSLEKGLAMADSIILATARAKGAVLWTQDAHLQGIEKVEYREKRKAAG